MTIRLEINHPEFETTDSYFVEWYTGLSTKQYTIIIDFEQGTITGDVIAYGRWVDIDLNECLMVLNHVTKHGNINRPYFHLLPLNRYPKDDT